MKSCFFATFLNVTRKQFIVWNYEAILLLFLENLKILSLGRNNIKNLNGLVSEQCTSDFVI